VRSRALLRRLLAVLVTALAMLTLPPSFAHAEDGYRYWSYFQWDGTQWAYALSGADSTTPADGAVEGWRFATSGSTPRTPRAAGDFATICAAAPPEVGRKRVAVVIDQGTVEDAPAGDTPDPAVGGTCVVAAPEATGAEVVGAVAALRTEQGVICGVGGYPATVCVDTIRLDAIPADQPVELQVRPPVGSNAAGLPEAVDQDFGNPVPVIIGGVLVLLLAGGGIWLARRSNA
jgi:hypothetical protein